MLLFSDMFFFSATHPSLCGDTTFEFGDTCDTFLCSDTHLPFRGHFKLFGDTNIIFVQMERHTLLLHARQTFAKPLRNRSFYLTFSTKSCAGLFRAITSMTLLGWKMLTQTWLFHLCRVTKSCVGDQRSLKHRRSFKGRTGLFLTCLWGSEIYLMACFEACLRIG
jgi:hypothetical protein